MKIIGRAVQRRSYGGERRWNPDCDNGDFLYSFVSTSGRVRIRAESSMISSGKDILNVSAYMATLAVDIL